MVLKRYQNDLSIDQKLVLFYFDDTGKPYVEYEETALSDRIANITSSTNWWTGSKNYNVEYY